MLTLNASALRAALHPTATNTPQGADSLGASHADPAGFASLLRQTQSHGPVAMQAPAPQAPPMTAARQAPDAATQAGAPDRAATDAADDNAAETSPNTSNDASTGDAAAPAESDTAQRTRALVRARLRSADGSGAAQRGAKPASTSADEPASGAAPAVTDATQPATTNHRDAATNADAALPWLAAQQRTDAKNGADDRGTSTVDGAAESADAARPHGRTHGLRGTDLKADADLNSKPAHGRDADAAANGSVDFAGVLAEQRIAEPAQRPAALAASSDVAAAAQSAPPPAALRDAGAAPTAVALPTPVDAPEFAQALGLQLSVLARDGISQAELHLNPAEMGPVSVQIVMDGSQARIDFGADVAATRQAIEAGLPELASALRDAGFTLAGGGVSQHAGSRGDGSGGRPGEAPGEGSRRALRAQGSDTVTRVAAAARRIVNAGGVDLYA